MWIVRTFVRVAFAITLCGLAGAAMAAGPNIIYILADDLGWKDVGFHRGAIPTPHLDRLARDGAVLNAMYAQPHSSQTHAAVLTGRYPMRYGLQTMSIMPASAFGLPKDERTLAELLEDAGYATAFVGAWRLGHARQEFWPTRRGFGYFFGSLSAAGAAGTGRREPAQWRRNDAPVRAKPGSDATELLAADAVRVIERHDRQRPLFLMLSLPVPASGQAPAALAARFRNVAEPGKRAHAAAVAALDQAVGQVLAALDRSGLRERTLLVFHSDNGGSVPTRDPTGDGDVAGPGADNGSFRGGKGSLYEGGVRVVAAIGWPGRIPPGTLVPHMLHVTDLFAMLVVIAEAGAALPKEIDGVDALPAIADGALGPRRQLLINIEEFRGALRVGDWKLVFHAALPGRTELFNLARDPEEAENVAAKHPERVKEMMATLAEFAYDMAPSLYLDDLGAAVADTRPIVWRPNPPLRQ